MNKITILGLAFALLFARQAFGQKDKFVPDLKKTPVGISWQAWEKMNDRWKPYSTRVFIQKKDGIFIDGQLTWMNDSVLLIQKNPDLPNGSMNPDDYIRIPVSDLVSMKIRLGGHPYQGLIYGLLAGVVPGFVTGAILAQGWTILPAVIFGAVTGAAGGVAGNFIQKANRKQYLEINAAELTGRTARRMKKSALFPGEIPELPALRSAASLPDFENLVRHSRTLNKAFPDNPLAFSLHTTFLTNSVRKRLQYWYSSPIWGPPDSYYEMRIGLQADISRRIGKQFQAGMLFQLFPGNISSSFFNKNLPDWNVTYSYNHHFSQTTMGIFGGWLLQPADRFWATRFEASVQLGAVVSDIYEHFYFQWSALSDYRTTGETFIQKHNYQPGGMLRLKTSWYLIPGFSIVTGLEGFLIKRVSFAERIVLPQTTDGPWSISQRKFNFSNIQGFIGLSIHL